ncbi:MAG: DNA-binding protein [bacterium]|jgi:chromosome segregation ATPase
MARGGIYKSEVVRARANLQAQGRYPSVDAIRIELGNTGSKTTIQRYLKEIEEEQGGRASSAAGLSDAIKDLAARLAEQLQSEADQRIAELQGRHTAELQAAREATAAVQKDLQAVNTALEQVQVELATGQQRYDELTARYTAELQARSQAQQQAADVRLQLEAETTFRSSLETKYADARRALEHFRDAAKEQREADSRKHESQVQFFQQEIRNMQRSLSDVQAKYVQANEEMARQTSELAATRREVAQLEGTRGQLVSMTERLTTALSERDAARAAHSSEKSRGDGLAAQVAAQAEEIRVLGEHLRQKEAEIAAATAREETVEQMHARFDQHLEAQLSRLVHDRSKPARHR